IVVYNDHGGDFFFDKYPTFAIGAADHYAVADEGMGIRPLPRVRGHFEFSRSWVHSLVYDEFDLTVCQELAVEHGFLVPMHLCFEHTPDWSIAAVPLAVNVLQHPLPTAVRCYKLGQAIRRAVESDGRELRVVVLGTGGMSHQLHGARFGHLNQAFDLEFLDRIEHEPASLARARCDRETRDRRPDSSDQSGPHAADATCHRFPTPPLVARVRRFRPLAGWLDRACNSVPRWEAGAAAH